jgi:hypothetical protein
MNITSGLSRLIVTEFIIFIRCLEMSKNTVDLTGRMNAIKNASNAIIAAECWMMC